LASSTKQLYQISDELQKKDSEFTSIQDHIDIPTSTGRAIFGMLAVFAEFERGIIQGRIQAGLQEVIR